MARSPKKINPLFQEFGRNLARLRFNSGLTQETLAEKADLSARYLQGLESGRYSPTIHVVGRLRKALDISWEDICRGI